MQNYKSNSLQRVGMELRERFDTFFLDLPTESHTTVDLFPQMPAFQTQLFIDRAVDQAVPVHLQLVSVDQATVTNVTGRVSKLKDGRLLIKTSQKVCYFTSLSQIRYVAIA